MAASPLNFSSPLESKEVKQLINHAIAVHVALLPALEGFELPFVMKPVMLVSVSIYDSEGRTYSNFGNCIRFKSKSWCTVISEGVEKKHRAHPKAAY
jgi:hypothetical protein